VSYISLSSAVLRGNGGDTLCAGYSSDHHSCSRVSFAVCACANIFQPEQPMQCSGDRGSPYVMIILLIITAARVGFLLLMSSPVMLLYVSNEAKILRMSKKPLSSLGFEESESFSSK
jgi:hypothetical protein